jgi:hypothetical protein
MKEKRYVGRNNVVKKLLLAAKERKQIVYFNVLVWITEVEIFNEGIPGHVLFKFGFSDGNEVKIKLYNWKDKDGVK